MSKIEEAKKLLNGLNSRVSDFKNLAIARTNGLVIASLGKSLGDYKTVERLIGAMGSALFSIAKQAATKLLDGTFQSLNIEIDSGNIFLIYTGKVILVALTKQEPNLGLISLEMEEAAKELNKIFG